MGVFDSLRFERVVHELTSLGTLEIRRYSESWSVKLTRGFSSQNVSASALVVALESLLHLARSA